MARHRASPEALRYRCRFPFCLPPIRMTRNTTTPIHPQFLGRMSPRAFKPEALSQAQIEQLADAARWAPSASNKQPWHFAYALRGDANWQAFSTIPRSEEHTSELQSQSNLVCRLLLEKKKKKTSPTSYYHVQAAVHHRAA